MTRYTPRSLAALFVSMAACAADPTPIDETGDTSTSDSTTASTSNTSPTTTDPSSTAETSTGTTVTTTTTDPTDTTSTADTTDSSSTTETTDSSSTTETTDATETTDGSESESSSSSGEVESSSSSETDPTGMKVDCSGGDGPDFMVTNNGFADYTIDGQNDPGLTVVRGCEYTFTVNANGHPFYIKDVQGNGANNAYNDGVDNNGTQNGVITWTVALDAPADLFYNCQFHAAMTGTITVIDP